MKRSVFDWQPPDGTTIEQVFLPSYRAQSGQDVYPMAFVAVCSCGVRSPRRAARSDALEEIDDHACDNSNRRAATDGLW